MYRYDKFPDPTWQSVSTFPHHVHEGSKDNVVPSPFPADPTEGFRAVLVVIASRLHPRESP